MNFNFFDKKKKKTSQQIFPSGSKIQIGNHFSIGKFKNIQVNSNATINMAEKVSFREFCNILTSENGTLIIGKNVFFNNYCSVNCLELIEIGENTLFGEGVKIYDHNHQHYIDEGLQIIERDKFTTAPIRIGKNCWIGSNVTILKGVEIGDNVIIGAGCLIYKSVQANTVIKLSQILL